MDDSIEAFDARCIDLACIRIPKYFPAAWLLPDQANDFVSTFNQVSGHG
jgi:hypothetical protein